MIVRHPDNNRAVELGKQLAQNILVVLEGAQEGIHDSSTRAAIKRSRSG